MLFRACVVKMHLAVSVAAQVIIELGIGKLVRDDAFELAGRQIHARTPDAFLHGHEPSAGESGKPHGIAAAAERFAGFPRGDETSRGGVELFQALAPDVRHPEITVRRSLADSSRTVTRPLACCS